MHLHVIGCRIRKRNNFPTKEAEEEALVCEERKVVMIIYKDIFAIMRGAGITTNFLRKTGIISESTLTRIRRNEPITTETIDILCQLLHCTPNDLIEVKQNE